MSHAIGHKSFPASLAQVPNDRAAGAHSPPPRCGWTCAGKLFFTNLA